MSVYDMNIHGCSIYQVGPPPSTPSPVVSSLSLLPWFLVAGLLELSFRPLLEGEGPSARASSSSSSSRGWLPAWLVGWEGREGLREDFRHLRYMMRDFQVNHLQRERTDTRSTQHRTQWGSNRHSAIIRMATSTTQNYTIKTIPSIFYKLKLFLSRNYIYNKNSSSN